MKQRLVSVTNSVPKWMDAHWPMGLGKVSKTFYEICPSVNAHFFMHFYSTPHRGRIYKWKFWYHSPSLVFATEAMSIPWIISVSSSSLVSCPQLNQSTSACASSCWRTWSNPRNARLQLFSGGKGLKVRGKTSSSLTRQKRQKTRVQNQPRRQWQWVFRSALNYLLFKKYFYLCWDVGVCGIKPGQILAPEEKDL